MKDVDLFIPVLNNNVILEHSLNLRNLHTLNHENYNLPFLREFSSKSCILRPGCCEGLWGCVIHHRTHRRKRRPCWSHVDNSIPSNTMNEWMIFKNEWMNGFWMNDWINEWMKKSTTLPTAQSWLSLVNERSINGNLGTSLVVQWLRLCAPSAEGPGWIPGRGFTFHMLQQRWKSPRARTRRRVAKWIF